MANNLDYIESNSKCNLTFTSSMSKEQYDKYIKSGVALRRNTYRGKDITDYKNLSENDPMNLYNQISSGNFNDIYVGDYINGNNGVTWLIADLDNYLYTGDQGNGLQTHHVTIIPLNGLISAPMNATNTTEGGYAGSNMYKDTLPKVLMDYIEPDFKDVAGKSHVITYRNLVTTEVTNGVSTKTQWEDRQLDLMSEANVYGMIVASSSAHDIGIDNQQYAIFQLRPELIYMFSGIRNWYWLKGVGNSSCFTIVYHYGMANAALAGSLDAIKVRPRFLIG